MYLWSVMKSAFWCTAPKKSASQETLPRNGYANNFGHSVGGEGYRGVEGVLLAHLTKPLVTRCVSCTKELYNSDNIVSSDSSFSHSAAESSQFLYLINVAFGFDGLKTKYRFVYVM